MLWRIAWRNLWRNRGRTLIMMSAVALTYALMLVSMGVGDDSHDRMLDEAIRAAGGDVIVHGDGYWASRASDLVIENAETVLATIRSTPNVQATFPRIIVNGLVATSASARPVLLFGVDRDAELQLNDILPDVSRGTFLEGGRDDPIVLGSRLVEKLEAEIGDRVVLTASRPDGELTRALFHLSGVLHTGARELDEVLGYTTLDAAGGAVGMEGRLTQIGVLSAGNADGQAIAQDIQAALGSASAGIEVLSWEDAVPEMVGYIELDNAFGYIYLGVIFLVVLFSITNTFLMAVMERVRELGLLSALGLRGARIGRLLLSETLLMTAMALGIGFAIGLGANLAIARWGIPVSAWGLEDIEVSGIDMSDMVIRSSIRPLKWTIASALVAVTTIASAVYPAYRASRLAPAEAMRFYE